jgi:hypothetical protein
MGIKVDQAGAGVVRIDSKKVIDIDLAEADVTKIEIPFKLEVPIVLVLKKTPLSSGETYPLESMVDPKKIVERKIVVDQKILVEKEILVEIHL